MGRFHEALGLLERAALAGDVEAQYRLGSLYRSGLGTKPDAALAFKWMKLSAEKGHAKSQYNVATMYLAARGTPFDLDKAQGWLRKAAAAGHRPAARLLAEIKAHPPAPPHKNPDHSRAKSG